MKSTLQIILEQCQAWKDTEEHEELSQQLTTKLKNMDAYTNDIECNISCLEAHCIEDGFVIGFISALNLFQELADFKSRYVK